MSKANLSDTEIKQRLAEYRRQIEVIQDRANELVRGRQVRITGDWNGQQLGHSWPSRKGKVYTASNVDLHGNWSSVTLKEHEYDSPPYLRDVEFL